jgi:hypothetical protein
MFAECVLLLLWRSADIRVRPLSKAVDNNSYASNESMLVSMGSEQATRTAVQEHTA